MSMEKSSRKLERSTVNWEKAAAALKFDGQPKGSQLKFSEVYDLVHNNNVGGVEFSFDQFTPEEKEHLIMKHTHSQNHYGIVSELMLSGFV